MNQDETRLLRYFIDRTDKRLDEINKKLDNLQNFKMKVIGMAVVLIAAIELFTEWIKK